MGEVEFDGGKIFPKASPQKSESFTDLLARHGNQPLEAVAKVQPDPDMKEKFAAHSFGAVFAEVSVDPLIGMPRVRRVVAVFDVGKIVNRETRSEPVYRRNRLGNWPRLARRDLRGLAQRQNRQRESG